MDTNAQPELDGAIPQFDRPDRLRKAREYAPPDVRVCLALASFAGFRACEIAGLDWSEVGTGPNATVRITEGKGGHSRVVPLSAALAAELNALPDRRGPVIRRRDGRAGPNRPHRISMMVNSYLREVDLTETLHQCRHRFATTAYRACQDIRAVMELMGHSSPATTSIYAASASAVAVSAVDAAGSLAA